MGKYQRCPYQFYLKVVLGLNVEYRPGEAAQTGNYYHDWFEEFFNTYKYEDLRKGRVLSFDDRIKQTFYDFEMRRARKLEWQHWMPIRELYTKTKKGMHGFIDRIHILPNDTAMIIEYKPKHRDSYFFELGFYTSLLENSVSISPRLKVSKWGAFYYKTREFKVWDVDREFIKNTVVKLFERVKHEIVLNDISLKKRDITACKYCDYSVMCGELLLGITTEKLLVREQELNKKEKDRRIVSERTTEWNKAIFRANQRNVKLETYRKK